MSEVQQATPEAARARAERIRSGMRVLAEWQDDVIAAYVARDWVALGYAAWDAYLDGEYGEDRVQLPREQRREMVAGMAQAGMSTRAIGAALSVDQKTVVNDRARSTEESSSVPERVLSLDGRERPASRPTRTTPNAAEEQKGPEVRTPSGDPESRPESAPSNRVTITDGRAAGEHEASQPIMLPVRDMRPPSATPEMPEGGSEDGALFEEPEDRAADDARLDASLAADMEDSSVVFRANFRPMVTAAYAMARNADVGRITQVYAAPTGDRDALIRDLRFIRDFCDRASEALSKTVQIRSAGGAQ